MHFSEINPNIRHKCLQCIKAQYRPERDSTTRHEFSVFKNK